MKLKGELLEAEALTAGRRAEMLDLMTRCYANVTAAHFHQDLAEKRWVILLTHPRSGVLCGFSTQMLLTVPLGGRTLTALFSGDTIVAPEYWGDGMLGHVWGNLALDLIDRHPPGVLYWFLISKGYKTYRFLPVFFHRFYPRYDAPMPVEIAGLIDAFARHKFHSAYDPASRIIRADDAKDRLRPGIADLPEGRLHDPHVAFFARTNPGHAGGDELCCLAPLTHDNFTPAARRVIFNQPVALGKRGVA